MQNRLLVLDDEALIAWGLAGEMEELGWTVEVAGTAAAALRLIERDAIDAALLDFNLRGETSEEVARAMIEKDLPFIFVSGTPVGNLPEFVRHLKVMSKPVDYPRIDAALRALINRPPTGAGAPTGSGAAGVPG